MNLTFTYENQYLNHTKITYETNAVSLGDVLAEFENFLRGAGFIFDGNLDIVKDDSDDLTDDVGAYNESDAYDTFLPDGSYIETEES